MSIEPGLTGRANIEVAYADSAAALGSGDLPVLGTPRVVALCEQATVSAVSGHLDDTSTTVGVEVEMNHTAPTEIGQAVSAQAELVEVEGRRLSFDVTAHDQHGQVANGRIVRVVVDRARFLEGLSNR